MSNQEWSDDEEDNINPQPDRMFPPSDSESEEDFSEFDYGLLGQFYYNINGNLLATVEGYYGLSKFSEDNDEEMTGIPNVFHYVNLGIAYKFGGKSK